MLPCVFPHYEFSLHAKLQPIEYGILSVIRPNVKGLYIYIYYNSP